MPIRSIRLSSATLRPKHFHVGNKPFRETNERNKYGKLFAIYQLHWFLKPENILDKKGIWNAKSR